MFDATIALRIAQRHGANELAARERAFVDRARASLTRRDISVLLALCSLFRPKTPFSL